MSNTDGKDEVQKLLDAMAIQQEFMLAVSGDEEALAALKEREELPDAMTKWIEKQADADDGKDGDGDGDGDGNDGDGDDDDGKGDGDNTGSDGVPKREDFELEIDYAKALVRYDRALKAQAAPKFSYKKPEPEDFATDEEYDSAKEAYDEFIKGLKDELAPVLGETIKKTLLPKIVDRATVDVKELFSKSLEDKISWEEFKIEEGLDE